MEKEAYAMGVRLALNDLCTQGTPYAKTAASRTMETLFGGYPSAFNDEPKDKFWPAYGRAVATGVGANLGALGGGGLGALLASLISRKAVVPAVGIGALGGLIGGGIGGRLLGEHWTDYDPERGY